MASESAPRWGLATTHDSAQSMAAELQKQLNDESDPKIHDRLVEFFRGTLSTEAIEEWMEHLKARTRDIKNLKEEEIAEARDSIQMEKMYRQRAAAVGQGSTAQETLWRISQYDTAISRAENCKRLTQEHREHAKEYGEEQAALQSLYKELKTLVDLNRREKSAADNKHLNMHEERVSELMREHDAKMKQLGLHFDEQKRMLQENLDLKMRALDVASDKKASD